MPGAEPNLGAYTNPRFRLGCERRFTAEGAESAEKGRGDEKGSDAVGDWRRQPAALLRMPLLNAFVPAGHSRRFLTRRH